MSCLLAVTTDMPAFRAPRTSSSAGDKPPISSTTMSASELRIVWRSSVQTTSVGTQGCFLRSTLRLQMCVSRSKPSLRSHRILATARPTVPKPTRATRRAELRSPEVGTALASDACSGGVLCNYVLSRAETHFYHTWGSHSRSEWEQRPAQAACEAESASKLVR